MAKNSFVVEVTFNKGLPTSITMSFPSLLPSKISVKVEGTEAVARRYSLKKAHLKA